MRSLLKNSPALSLLTVLVASACVAGCAENNQSLYILGNGIPSSACTVVPSESGPFRGSGTLDILVGTNYHLFPIVVNGMPSSKEMHNFQESDGRLEAHNVFMRRAKVEYDYDPAIRVNDIRTDEIDISGSVAIEGLAAVDVRIVNNQLVSKLRDQLEPRSTLEPFPGAQIVVDVQIVGEMSDGTEISSNVFSFPLWVCRGCLLDFPVEADNTASPELDCDVQSSGTIEQPCTLGQDDKVDCRLCKRARSQDQDEQAQCNPM